MATIPAFSLPGSDGRAWTDKDLRGAAWVLYCYPKDNTSGCTAEACDFRAHHPEFSRLGVRVVGLSPDSVKSHQGFIAKQQLPFLLLADPEHALLAVLGVWVEKSLYGRRYMGVERSTFLIGADGAILREWRKVKVLGHVAEVLTAASGC